MQTCPQCGSVNPDESQFCNHCGYKMNQVCPACHFINLPDQAFCGSCGQQLATGDTLIAPGFDEDEPPAPTPVAAPQVSPPQPKPLPAPESLPVSAPTTTPAAAAAHLTVQWMGIDTLLESGVPLDQLNVLKTRCTDKVHAVVSAYGGSLSAVKGAWLSFVFQQEADLAASAMAALSAAFQLAATPLANEEGHFLKTLMAVTCPQQSESTAQSAQQRAMQLFPLAQAGQVLCDAQIYQALAGQITTQRLEADGQGFLVLRPEPAPTATLKKAPPAPEPVLSVEPPPPVETVTPVKSPQRPAATKTLPPFPRPDALPGFTPLVVSTTKSKRITNATYEEACQALAHEFQSLIDNQQPGVVTAGRTVALCAGEGLGKTNILHMSREAADPELKHLFWFWGSAYGCHQRDQLPLQLWMDVFNTLFGLIPEGQPPSAMRQAIHTTLIELGIDDPAIRQVLELLMAVEAPEPLTAETVTLQGRLAGTLMSLFQQLTAHRPVVLVLEDIDKADSASVALLNDLLTLGLTRLPVLLLVSHPSDFYWAGDLAAQLKALPHKEVVVADLTHEQMFRYLEGGPFGDNIHQVPPEFLSQLFARAKGKPLFLEETLRLLHWEGKLTLDEQGHFLPATDQPLAFEVFPDNVGILIQRRISHLPEDTRYVLQMASILGERFPLSLLQLLAQQEDEAFQDQLKLLDQQGYLTPDALNTGRFRHAVIWRTVYDTMEKSLRQQGHQLISQALENDLRQQLGIQPALLAYHAEHGELPNRAFTYWNMTGVQAAQLGVLEGANSALFRALAYLPGPAEEAAAEEDDPRELMVRLQENLGMLNLSAHPGLSADLFRWVAFERQTDPDQARFVETLGYLASALEYGGRYEEALAAVNHSLARVPVETYPLEVAFLLATKTEYHYTLGRLGPATETAGTLTELAEKHQLHRQPETEMAVLNGRLIEARVQLERFDRSAFDTLNQIVSYAASHGQETLYLASALARCHGLLAIGRYVDVDTQADALLHQIEALPDNDWFLAHWGLLAIQYHHAFGEAASADPLLLTVINCSRKANDFHTWLKAQAWAGHLAALSGDTLKARELLEKSVNDSAEYKFASCALLGWRFLAEFELSQGYTDVAYEIARSALVIARKGDIENTREEYLLSMVCARCLMQQGRLKEAGHMLESLWPALVETRFAPLIADGAELIGILYTQIAETVKGAHQRKYQERAVQFFDKARHGWLEMQNAYRVKAVQIRQQQVPLTVA